MHLALVFGGRLWFGFGIDIKYPFIVGWVSVGWESVGSRLGVGWVERGERFFLGG